MRRSFAALLFIIAQQITALPVLSGHDLLTALLGSPTEDLQIAPTPTRAPTQRSSNTTATPTTSTLPAVGVYTVRTVAELTQRVAAAKDFDVILLGAGTYKDGNDFRIK
jgi:hypothetical protein